MASQQLLCCSERREAKLQNPILTEYTMILICILVLTSLHRTGVCDGLPLEPFGYINIDCGGEGSYNDTLTGLEWVGEKDYLLLHDELIRENITSLTKVVMNDSSSTFRNNAKQLETARIFTSSGSRKYCYNIDVSLSNQNSSAYLVRAMFPPRNVPGSPFVPSEEVIEANALGFNPRGNVDRFSIAVDSFSLDVFPVDYEPATVELLVTSLDSGMDICLILPWFSDTQKQTAAISSLEVRSIPEVLYPLYDHGKLYDGRTIKDPFTYYVTVSRLNFGGNESSPAIRYPLDRYDRLWYAAPHDSWSSTGGTLAGIKTGLESEVTVKSMNDSTVTSGPLDHDSFQVPPAVWTSAWEGVNLNSAISFSLLNLSVGFFTPEIYSLSIVLSDIDSDKSGWRSVHISNEDSTYYSGINPPGPQQWILQDAEVPKARASIWSDRRFQIYAEETRFEIGPGANSSLPAMINALELYRVIEDVSPKTIDVEVSILQNLRDTLPVSIQIFSSGDPCVPLPWYWVQCKEVGGMRLTRVEKINLSSHGLQKDLVGGVLKFPLWLTVLDLSNNSLNSTLPSAWEMPSYNLVKLDLSDNNFIGPIPDSFFSFSPLEFFNLSSNNMSGPLTGFGAYPTSLRILDLSHNCFTSSIPTFPDRSLEVLNLSSNHLSGSINVFSDPYLLGNDMKYPRYNESGLQPLRALRLENNNFSGMIPDYIWSSESLLETVDLSNNRFTELNLTSWTKSLLKNEIFNGRQHVNLEDNPISKVIFGGADVMSDLESRTDKDMHTLLARTPGYIMLGVNNAWCNSSALNRARVLKSYLCRQKESDDYYYWTLQQRFSSSKRTLGISLGVSGSAILVMACILLVFLGRMCKRMKNLRQIQEELAKEDVRPPYYKYEELRVATKDFSKENELGKGGFGAVYKAELADKSIVAVKLLYPMEQNLIDFLKETVLITGIKHRHLVQLKGCCVRDKKRILVYEFAENGNLAQALWGKGGSLFLTWAQRLKICVGVAKGLSYLHEELHPKIIHRDIKPYNILLDKDWNAKIADFGLARHMEGDAGTQATRVGGTLGYISPEYSSEGLITEKLDVFSYGILLLEIISGRLSSQACKVKIRILESLPIS